MLSVVGICSINCMNGGSCVIDGGREMCVCPDNYWGTRCEDYRKLFERRNVRNLPSNTCALRLETKKSRLNTRRGRQYSFVEIDHEIFSMVILSLPLIQEGQLSVSGERMGTILVNRLED